VPDLQRHICGLAAEQHCKEVMRSQICPGIIYAVIKRNQAAYEVLDQAMQDLLVEMNEVRTDLTLLDQRMQRREKAYLIHEDLCQLNDALKGHLDAYLGSFAGLTRGERLCDTTA
jgi:hypothetical protein